MPVDGEHDVCVAAPQLFVPASSRLLTSVAALLPRPL